MIILLFNVLLDLPEFASVLAADIFYNGKSSGNRNQCASCSLSYLNVSKHVITCKPVSEALGQKIIRALVIVLMGNYLIINLNQFYFFSLCLHYSFVDIAHRDGNFLLQAINLMIKYHSPEKTHSCLNCGFDFSTKEALLVHRIICYKLYALLSVQCSKLAHFFKGTLLLFLSIL